MKLKRTLCHAALWAAVALVALPLLWSCSSTKHVAEGQMLLDDVTLNILDKQNQTADVSTYELVNYVRQQQNHEVLGGLKLQLALYNLSGKDSSKWFNRWVQRVGTPPVIYDSTLTQASVRQLNLALINKGYMQNQVTSREQKNAKKKKVRVTYDIRLNQPYYVRSIGYDIADDSLRQLILADTTLLPIRQGSVFDHNKLNTEREIITQSLRDQGYYAFNKEYITFVADTAEGSRAVDLTLVANPPKKLDRLPGYVSHRRFWVRNVTFVTNYDPVTMQDGNHPGDTTEYHGYLFIQGPEHYLRRKVLEECCYIIPGESYDASNFDRTYKALSRLGILKFVNITTQVVGEIDGKLWVDAYVLLNRGSKQNISVSVEGTNSDGDLGFGIGLDYQHANLINGSETFSAKFRTSYQSISGKLGDIINDNYSEYSGEIGLTYPKFKAPFLKRSFTRRIQASTEFALNFNYQTRPEYTRIIAGAGWNYIWSERQNMTRHVFNLIDLSYVYLPKSRANFLDSITNPLLRYSYEDHLILRMGYSFYHTNKAEVSPLNPVQQRDFYTLRVSGEVAGNLLYAISKISGQSHDQDDAYKVFGIRYSQYVKMQGDFAMTHSFSSRSSVAVHGGLGVLVPYGNSSVAPFEKRFYAGGANSVRGWGVRTLGPGKFNAHNMMNDFIYQCGDIRLDASVEFRSKLFWVLEGAAFIDAGNIWTIRDYPDQPGGVFKFNKFYEQIALAYGVGLRMNFNYFLVRLDMGMKAFNPASGQRRWPIGHPSFSDDAEFHFAVGYPF